MPYQPAVLGPNTRLNNFRLNYLTAAQAGDRPTHIRIILGGVDITTPGAVPRVIYKSMTIRDLVFDAPNTCALTLYGGAPTVGQRLEVWIGADPAILLFAGELQTVERTYKGRPTTVVHPCTAIDDTAQANRKRPLMLFTNVSATTVAQTLISTYCPGYSSAGVEANLPPVTVNFDGSEGGLKGCLTQVAKLIGGYWYFENKVLYLFVTPPGPSPDPIDETPHRFAQDPAITWTMDKSQVRTRVYGKGASTRILTTIAASTDLLPIEEATMFNPAGGKAILGVSPDAAASRVVTYTGVQLQGGGGLVGPGAAPSTVPGLALLDGPGMESGVHKYAYTFTTAAGESLPSPIAAITVGTLAPPSAPPTPGTPTTGGAVDAGVHYYVVTFVTAVGETLNSVQSAPVTTTNVGGPVASAPLPNFGLAMNQEPHLPGGRYYYAYGYQTAYGSTLPGPNGWIDFPNPNTAGQAPYQYTNACRSTDPRVTHINVYRTAVNQPPSALRLLTQLSNAANPTALFLDVNQYTLGAPAPTVDTSLGASYQTVPLTGIPIGPAGVTGRRLYRWDNNVWRLLTTIANNTATTYTDTAPVSSLSGSLPASNTATANKVQISLALGGASVLTRKVYRTKANQEPLLLFGIVPNNTMTVLQDASPDAELMEPAPVTDTSGLTQPSGQVPAGSTAIIVANPAPFAATGGWAVVGNGEQVIRYSGTTANSLTGIPATGPGALVASVSYNSTITAAPALVGVVGILEQVLRGSPIHVWVQRDDVAAQAYMTGLDGGGDGVYEHIMSDERRSEASLMQICDADLALYSRPLVTVIYATRDLKTKSGKTVAITLTSPAINESLTIQDVAISEIGVAPRLAPKFTVTASTVHHSFEAILQKLIREAGA